MNDIQNMENMLWTALWFSPLGALLGLLPPLGLALSNRSQETRWLIPASRYKQGVKVPYFLLGTAGGCGGAIVALLTLVGALEWECYTRHFGCNDGQGGIMLIFTVPCFAIVCSSLALVWTSLSFRIPEASIWASVFRYSGERRLMNWLCALAIQASFWGILVAVVFRMTLATL
jgi:hypothetical protein